MSLVPSFGNMEIMHESPDLPELLIPHPFPSPRSLVGFHQGAHMYLCSVCLITLAAAEIAKMSKVGFCLFYFQS